MSLKLLGWVKAGFTGEAFMSYIKSLKLGVKEWKKWLNQQIE